MTGDKLTRFGPFSSRCRAGNVKIRRGSWNEDLFHVREGFPDLAHDDEVDACSGALKMLNPSRAGARMKLRAKTPRRSAPRSNASRKAPHPIRFAAPRSGEPCRKTERLELTDRTCANDRRTGGLER
jgi:hypothetical protein